jgi:hypothetical protein
VSVRIVQKFRHRGPGHQVVRITTIPAGAGPADPDRDVYCEDCGAFFPVDEFELLDSVATILPVLA